MLFDASAFTNALKIKYGKKLRSQVNERTTVLKLFSDDSESWLGKYVSFPILVGRGQSFMAHGSLGLLPTPQDEMFHECQIPVRWVRGRIMFEVGLMFQSASNVGAFAKSTDMLIKRLVVNLSDELNRMLSSGSGTGILALVDDSASVGSAGDPLEVDSPAGVASDGYGARFLQPGMLIGFTDGTTLRAIRQIVSISSETATGSGIVLDSPVTNGVHYANNDFIVRVANASVTNLTRDTSYNNEPMGLQGIVNDGTLVQTFQNVDRVLVPDWQATVLNVGALSLDALQRLHDTIDQQSGESITHNLVHHSVRRQYFALVDTARTFMQTGKGPGQFDLGQEPSGVNVTYNGLPIEVDKDLLLGEWMCVNKDHLTRYVLREGEWAEETGSMFRSVDGQDALQAIYRVALNYGTDQCNAHGKLTGMSITNAIHRHIV